MLGKLICQNYLGPNLCANYQNTPKKLWVITQTIWGMSWYAASCLAWLVDAQIIIIYFYLLFVNKIELEDILIQYYLERVLIVILNVLVPTTRFEWT